MALQVADGGAVGNSYNWGILGAGHIARKFVRDLRLVPGAQVVAVGSRDSERARQFAHENGIPGAYGSYEELVADNSIDIVYVASRHVGHYPDTMLALGAGKAVLCEKPAAMNLQQFECMVECARRQGCFFMEALWTRFLPSYIRCMELLREGAIGRPVLIEADFCMRGRGGADHRQFNPLLGGGSLLDIGIYPLFFCLEAGGAVRDLRAVATINEHGIDTNCAVVISHCNGTLSVARSSLLTEGANEAIIRGTDGWVRLNRWWHTPVSIDLFVNDAQPRHIEFDEPGGGYQHEAAEVMRCMDEGRVESLLWPWESSRNLMATLDRVRELVGLRYSPDIEAV